jgi:uncharacterized phage protein (TIGR02218 family)
MTFPTYETSLSLGEPIRLYTFTRGGGSWYYTSSDTNITIGDIVYKSAPISDSGFTQSGSRQDDSLEITMSNSEPMPMLFSATPPSTKTYITVSEMHSDDPDRQVYVSWKGTVRSVNIPKIGTAIIKCASLLSDLTSNGLRKVWGRECGNCLYDHNCRVVKADYLVEVTIISVAGNGMVGAAFASLANGRFAGGTVEWQLADGTVETRGILTHASSAITVIGLFFGLSVGDVVNAYPGCQRTWSDCSTYYSNTLNYDGEPYMSGRSPFDGDPVF